MKTTAACTLMLAAACLTTGRAATRTVRIVEEKPEQRRWQHWGNKVGLFDGTFERLSENRAFIRDPQGKLLEIPRSPVFWPTCAGG